MRAMRTLGDVNHALLDDLAVQYRYRRHWFLVGRLVLAAASSESRLSVTFATDALLVALEIEGWMTAQQRMREASIHDFPAPVPKPEIDYQSELPLAA
jgi:hypothetical protein